jgi:ectoine hydroxylase-related dioxygenase (phytanoyl-CoA dioxygenase family)
MAEDGDVQSVPARVVELTGEPGDVVLCHPMLFHCVSPNTAACPRFMRTTMIKRLPA